MLVVPHDLRPSPIHGLGVFATAPIVQGETVSRFMPPFDIHFPEEVLPALSDAERRFLGVYAYKSKFSMLYILPGDHDRFMNHSDAPNVAMHSDGRATCVAVRDIAAGEELTCDYRTFDLDWREKLAT
jgi:uncharacterized protein